MPADAIAISRRSGENHATKADVARVEARVAKLEAKVENCATKADFARLEARFETRSNIHTALLLTLLGAAITVILK